MQRHQLLLACRTEGSPLDLDDGPADDGADGRALEVSVALFEALAVVSKDSEVLWNKPLESIE